MRKTLTYSGFGIASFVVVAVFLTSKTYIQLGGAVLLYPLLVYLAYELFLRNKHKGQEPFIAAQAPPVNEGEGNAQIETAEVAREKIGVVDIDKRAFLKLIGVAGLSFFLFSLISRKSESLFFGKALASGTTALEDSSGNKINPSERQPTDGYRISEIDDDEFTFYGFINNMGAWFIMKEDSDTGSFRYSKGGVDFPKGWSGRKKLTYDYYHNIFSQDN